MSFDYEIEYQGRKIRCRTLDHVQRALGELEGSRLIKDGTRWTKEEFSRFTERIHYQQRRLLAMLLKAGISAWVEDSTLREELNIPGNKALAGVLSGISKVALAFDIDPRRVYIQRTTYKQAKPHRSYQVSPEFLKTATKHDWPSQEDLTEPR